MEIKFKALATFGPQYKWVTGYYVGSWYTRNGCEMLGTIDGETSVGCYPIQRDTLMQFTGKDEDGNDVYKVVDSDVRMVIPDKKNTRFPQ